MKKILPLFLAFAIFTLSSYGQCNLTLSGTDATCDYSYNGSATATATGTPPFNYYWSNGVSTENNDNIGVGTYSCMITDAVGCSSSTQYVTISSPAAVTFLPDTIHDENCYGSCNGDATIYPEGGTPPYSYNWDNGQITQQANSLCATSHYVTITDFAGCIYYHNVAVSGPTQIQNTANIYATNCTSPQGIIMLTTQGGNATAAYNYSWSNSASSYSIGGLASGIYSVTVSDVSGCSIVNSYIVNPSDGVIIDTLMPRNVTCNGMQNGGIASNFSFHNGQPPFTFQWTGQAPRTIPALDPVGPGDYYVTITANGCNTYGLITITEPLPINSHASVMNNSCFGDSSGHIYLMPTGGNAQNYTYTWGTLPMNPGPMAYMLHAGTYPVTITDPMGCTLSENLAVTEPPQLIANVIPVNISCSGFTDGKVIINMTGGTSPYYFSLDSASWDINDTIWLSAGQYTLYIKDQNYCHIPSIPFTIVDPPVFSVSETITNPTCTDNDGIIQINSTGGVPPYTFSCNNSQSGAIINNLSQGVYAVSVSDAYGCTNVQSYNLSLSSFPAKLTGSISYSGGTIQPNEAEVILFRSANIGAAQMDTVRTVINVSSIWEFNNLLPGIYFVKANIINPSFYPNLLNSYYNSTFQWQNAVPIILSCDDNTNITLNMVTISPVTTGDGSITGTIHMLAGAKSTNAAGEPVPGAEILIEQEPNDVPIQCALTDTAGQYILFGLNAGSGYKLIVQIPGFPLLSTYQNITVSSNSTVSNLNFLVDASTGGGIYKDSIGNINVSHLSLNKIKLEVYPNPFVTNFNLKLNLDKSEDISIELFDELGQTILKTNNTPLSEGEHVFNILPKNTDSGNFYLMIKSGKTVLVKKLTSIK
jgi:hypothetical protein